MKLYENRGQEVHGCTEGLIVKNIGMENSFKTHGGSTHIENNCKGLVELA